MNRLKAIEPKKSTYALSTDSDLVIGICGDKCVMIFFVEARAIVLNQDVNGTLLSTGFYGYNDASILVDLATKLRLG
jgi:hypothetical protein